MVQGASSLQQQTFTDLAQAAIQLIRNQGCEYGEIRLCTYRQQRLWAQDRSLKRLSDNVSAGFGVRVLWQGSWGFAASHRRTEAEVVRIVQLAVDIAKGSYLSQREPVRLVPVPTYCDRYTTPIQIDPFSVPLTEKTDLLLDLNEQFLNYDPQIKKAYAYLSFTQEDKIFASTEGSVIEQRLYRSGAGMGCTAVADGDAQSRKYERSPLNLGYEHIEPETLKANVERVAREALEKVHAPEAPSGEATLILKPSHLWLPIHESVGHPTELDRVYGYEANFAGTSFATTNHLNQLQYAAPWVNFKADHTQPGGRSTTGYDDEGVKAQEWYVVKDGVLVDYLTDRETAHRLGRPASNGCAFADSWASVPMVRIPNLGLEPGRPGGDRTATLAEMIADTKDGYLIDGDDTFSIDQQRRNFQFGGNGVWHIKNGNLNGMVKNLTYQGLTTDFWNKVEAIAPASELEQRGTDMCGKGEPMQIAQMTHACVPIRVGPITIGR
ncbi:TldD/PmbA family protein [[Synechococcus] sp. NIES-970]|nr:TldD/PmbA family protein [[Synechococcus] sp. NIES-970]